MEKKKEMGITKMKTPKKAAFKSKPAKKALKKSAAPALKSKTHKS